MWEDASLWAHWIHSIHSSYTSALRGQACFLVHFKEWQMAASCLLPALQQSPWGVAVSTPSQFGEPSFTFGGQKSLMAVTFLIYWYGSRYFHFTVLHHDHKFDHIWETFDDLSFLFFVPRHWETYPRSGKVLIDMSLQVLIFRLGLLIIKDSLNPQASNLTQSRRNFPCCFFPYLESQLQLFYIIYVIYFSRCLAIINLTRSLVIHHVIQKATIL